MFLIGVDELRRPIELELACESSDHFVLTIIGDNNGMSQPGASINHVEDDPIVYKYQFCVDFIVEVIRRIA